MTEQSNKFQNTECEFRQVPIANGVTWLTHAYYIFKLKPKVWLACVLVMMLIMTLIPLVQVFAPVFTAGLMYGCQNLKNHQTFEFSHLFKGFKFQFNRLAIIGLIYLGCALISYLIAESAISSLGYPLIIITPEMITSNNVSMETLQAYIISMSLLWLIMMSLMLPVFMAFWFSPALIILRNCEPVYALKQSFLACTANIKAFTIYGIASLFVMLLIFAGLIMLWFLSSILSLLLMIFFSLAFMGIFYASMFTSFDDIFPSKEQFNSNREENDKSDEDGADTLIL